MNLVYFNFGGVAKTEFRFQEGAQVSVFSLPVSFKMFSNFQSFRDYS